MHAAILFVGIWTTTCIQTQISNHAAGYARETYTIETTGAYEFKRDWYHDPACQEHEGTDTEAGTLEVGKKISTIFMPGDVWEANWSAAGGVDAGAIAVRGNKLRLARGIKNSTMRNTMLGLFEYEKQ
jgi:hypothetical protein